MKVESQKAFSDEGLVAALRRVLNILQDIIDRSYENLKNTGTCSREFLEFVDKLEERLVREMTGYGFRRVNVRSASRSDIVLGVFAAGNLLVEIGIRDINKCGVLEEVSGGRPPRVYARLYIGGRAALILEAEERAGEVAEKREASYII